MKHSRNSDDYLAKGTDNEVSASNIKQAITEGLSGAAGTTGATGTTGAASTVAGTTGATGTTGSGGSGLTFIPVVLLNNQSTPQLLFSYPKTNRFSFFLFSIERNGTFQQIYTQKVTDGNTVSGGNNSNNIGTTGITITAAIVGDNVEIYYISTNTGFNGTFKYAALTQWS
jgi:hypothetical protein